MKLIKN